MAKLEVFDPTTDPKERPITYVARPDSLRGKRVGLVENTKFNSDKLLLKIGKILVEEYGAAEVRIWRKHNSSVPAHEEILDELSASCNVMIAGIGD